MLIGTNDEGNELIDNGNRWSERGTPLVPVQSLVPSSDVRIVRSGRDYATRERGSCYERSVTDLRTDHANAH